MRDYQLEGTSKLRAVVLNLEHFHWCLPHFDAGLNWMISLHENGLNGILADEMGLGTSNSALNSRR